MTNFLAEITPLELFLALAFVSMALGCGWTVGIKLFDAICNVVTACIAVGLITYKKVTHARLK